MGCQSLGFRGSFRGMVWRAPEAFWVRVYGGRQKHSGVFLGEEF